MIVSLTAPRPRSLGVSAAVACMVGGIAGAVASVIADADDALAGHAYEDALSAVVWSVLGTVLLRRAPANRFGRLFVAVGASFAVAEATDGYAQLAPGLGLAGGVICSWIAGWVWTVGTFLPVTFVPLWFPDGRPASRRWAVVGCASAAGIALLTVSLTADPVFLSPSRSVPAPVHIPASGGLFGVGSALVIGGAVAAVAGLVVRLVRSTGERRRQIAPLVAALAVSVPVLLVAGLVPAWSAWLQLVTMPLVPTAIVLAVLRYRLYDLEIVVRRSLVFVGLTAVVVGGYALVVTGTASLLRHRAGLSESLIATGVVALAFQPARVVLQRTVGRWLYGERVAPHRALAAVGEQLAGAADPTVAVAAAVAQVREALRLPWVAVTTDSGEVAASGPRPRWIADDGVVRFPLVHLGTVCGELLAAPRSPRERLSAGDRELLEQLAVPVAAVVAADRLIADLRRSRERVVLAREEERRRLRRDLHDGVGPLLSAIVTQADVASLRLERGAPDAGALVGRLRGTSTDAITALRRVVEDLRPADVDELGLDGALRGLAAALSVPGSAVIELDADPLPELPAAVDLAAFRIASEAVTNAVRHGGARRIEILLAVKGHCIDLCVADDGRGFARGGVSPGIGLQSMRERAEELGGRLAVSSSAATGTLVHAVLPLHLEADA